MPIPVPNLVQIRPRGACEQMCGIKRKLFFIYLFIYLFHLFIYLYFFRKHL